MTAMQKRAYIEVLDNLKRELMGEDEQTMTDNDIIKGLNRADGDEIFCPDCMDNEFRKETEDYGE